jgi:hypothetical protein
MPEPRLKLSLLPDTFAICRLDPGATIPTWALQGGFASITRTSDELSIMCPESQVPEGVQREAGWRVFKVEGPLDFSLTGILAAIVSPFAAATISVFAVSTYDTDYLLIKRADLDRAVQALSARGHDIARA